LVLLFVTTIGRLLLWPGLSWGRLRS
jgi:hypothetical protein